MREAPPFMPWIDYLPEVGDPIRKERNRLRALAQQAAEMEEHALSLRAQVAAGQSALLGRVLRTWTLADLQSAAEAAGPLDSGPVLPGAWQAFDDPGRRECIRRMDGWHLASEALMAFRRGRVIRQHNLMSTATDEERRETLRRMLDWWNIVARPVYERLAGDWQLTQ